MTRIAWAALVALTLTAGTVSANPIRALLHCPPHGHHKGYYPAPVRGYGAPAGYGAAYGYGYGAPVASGYGYGAAYGYGGYGAPYGYGGYGAPYGYGGYGAPGYDGYGAGGGALRTLTGAALRAFLISMGIQPPADTGKGGDGGGDDLRADKDKGGTAKPAGNDLTQQKLDAILLGQQAILQNQYKVYGDKLGKQEIDFNSLFQAEFQKLRK